MAHAIDERHVAQFLDVLYDAAVASESWPRALASLAELFSSAFADIFTRSHDREHFRGLAHGMDSRDYEDIFLGFWCKRNVWGQAKPVRVAGEVISTRAMVDPATLRRSAMFNEFLDPRGLHEGLRFSLRVDAFEIQDISLLRPWSCGAFGDAEVALGRILLPHLQRAAAVSRRLREIDFALETGASGAGPGSIAAIVFDSSGAPFWCNEPAEALLGRGTVLRRNRGGALSAASVEGTARLEDAVARATGKLGRLRSGRVVPLPRPDDHEGPSSLVVLPLSNARDWTWSRPPAAVAFVRDPAARVPTRELLKRMFPLTDAEAEIARDIARGSSPRDVAARTGRSLNTVRSHLARLMDKTGVHRRTDLLRILGEVAALGPDQPCRPIDGGRTARGRAAPTRPVPDA